jgi:hypothetical protein
VLLSCAWLLVVMALSSGCGGRAAAPYEQSDARYRFTYRLEKVRGETGACTGIMMVRDLSAGRVISIPIFTTPWGATTTAKGRDAAYGAEFEVTVDLNAAGTSGKVRGTLRRGESLIASRTATVPVTVSKNAPEIKIR